MLQEYSVCCHLHHLGAVHYKEGRVEGSPPVQVCKSANNLNCDHDPEYTSAFLANLCVVLVSPCPLATNV